MSRVIVTVNGKNTGPVEPDRSITVMDGVVAFGVFPRNVDLLCVGGGGLFNYNFGVYAVMVCYHVYGIYVMVRVQVYVAVSGTLVMFKVEGGETLNGNFRYHGFQF